MISLDKLHRVVDGVSFGDFRPAIQIEVTTKVTSTEERPAILISIETVDAMKVDDAPIRLYECFAAPDLEDAQLAVWIKERCQDLLLHEMDEFFRFQGAIIIKPTHPVAEGVFDEVRERVYKIQETRGDATVLVELATSPPKRDLVKYVTDKIDAAALRLLGR